jgi:hypothetical protein
MGDIKTKMTTVNVLEYIDTLESSSQKQDSLTLLHMLEEITKHPAKMWGPSIIGFDVYHYKSTRSSQEGDWPRIAFAARKGKMTLYCTHGLQEHTDLLEQLGPHSISVGCLYIKRLDDVDMKILKKILVASYKATFVDFPA